MKAVKNHTECEGFRRAMERDGVAMVQFLKWLEEAVPKGYQTELTASAKLYELRAKQPLFRDISFDTIAAYADHANRRRSATLSSNRRACCCSTVAHSTETAQRISPVQ